MLKQLGHHCLKFPGNVVSSVTCMGCARERDEEDSGATQHQEELATPQSNQAALYHNVTPSPFNSMHLLLLSKSQLALGCQLD